MLRKYIRFMYDVLPADAPGLADVALEVKGLKTEAQKSVDAYTKVSSELEILKKANEAWGTKDTQREAELVKMKADIETVNKHNEKLEGQLKAKSLTPGEQLKFADLLGKAIEDNWSEISKFKDSSSPTRVKFEVITKAVADMGITVSVTDPGAYFTTVLPGIRALPNRKVHMRDLIPLGTMTNSSVTFMREVGGEGDLAPVAENAAKPQFDRDFIEVTVAAENIAGWLRVSRKMLDDMAAFRSYLQMRLLEMYLKAEDNQILNGNGTSPQLQGILAIASAAIVTAGPNVERLVRAISQLESGDYTATGGILHPAAYFDILLNKASGSGEYDLPTALAIVQNGQLYIAGVPFYKTTAIAQTTYIVGDWQLGAQLFIRQQPIVEFFDQDANNVTTNKITVRIEGRVALAIFRAEAFVTGTLTVPTT